MASRRFVPRRFARSLRQVCVLLFALHPSPILAREISEADRVAIARTLSDLLPAIDVTYTGAPILLGDAEPLVFRLAPTGKPGFGNLFNVGRHDIIHRPDDTFNFGTYLCHLGREFARARRAQNAGFLLPRFEVGGSLEYKPIKIEMKGTQDTLADLVNGILYLWDEATKADYGRFEILVRGYADEGRNFVGTQLSDHPITRIPFFPKRDADPAMMFYLRAPQSVTIGQHFGNAELPNLRASYVKEIIDGFLTSCRVQQSLTPTSHVLDGAVIAQPNRDYRSIELFFYAVR